MGPLDLLKSEPKSSLIVRENFEFLPKLDDPVKSRKCPRIVIPVKPGIQSFQNVLDLGFRRSDRKE
jgi:hypothetical protein